MDDNQQRDNGNEKTNNVDNGRSFQQNYNEEYASDLTTNRMDNSQQVTGGGTIAGVIGVGAGIIAMFVMPITLGILGIIMGGVATARGARTMGITAIVLGIIAAGAALLFRAAVIRLFFSMF